MILFYPAEQNKLYYILYNFMEDKENKTTMKDLTEGNPMKLILGFAIPMLFGFLFQQFYNMVDTIIMTITTPKISPRLINSAV